MSATAAASGRVVVKVGSSSLTGRRRAARSHGWTGPGRRPGRRAGRAHGPAARSSSSPPARSPRGSGRWAWPAGRATWRPSRRRPASGRACSLHRYTESFARHGITVGQVLLTSDDMVRRGHHRNAQRTLTGCSTLGVLPVVNENDTVATDEIRFGDNDRLAALVAHLVRADALVLLSDVDGLYEGDPPAPAPRKITEVARRRRPRRGPARPGRRQRRGHRRHGQQGGGRPDRRRGRECRRSWPRPTRGRGRPRRRVGRHRIPRRRRPGLPTRLLWLAHATTPRGPAAAGRRRGPRGRRAAALAARGGGRRRSRAASWPATRSTSLTKTVTRWPAGW